MTEIEILPYAHLFPSPLMAIVLSDANVEKIMMRVKSLTKYRGTRSIKNRTLRFTVGSAKFIVK